MIKFGAADAGCRLRSVMRLSGRKSRALCGASFGAFAIFTFYISACTSISCETFVFARRQLHHDPHAQESGVRGNRGCSAVDVEPVALPTLLGRRCALSSGLPALAAYVCFGFSRDAFAEETTSVDAKKVLEESDTALADALRDWEIRLPPEGDTFRRVLGTVGSKSPLYKLTPAMKALYSEDPDLVEQAEKIEDERRQADFLAYSSYFCGTSAGGGTSSGLTAQLPGSPTTPCGDRYLMGARQQMVALRREVQNFLRKL